MTADSATAGLWRRIGAFGFDYLWIAAWLLVVVAIGAIAGIVAPDLRATLFGDPMTGQLVGFTLVTLPVSLVFVVSEAGETGATWGKRRMRLRVATADGGRLTPGRSIARTALKFLPWELSHAVIWRFAVPGAVPEWLLSAALAVVWGLIGANLISALIDDRRRTIYDRLAGTRVVMA